MSRKQQVADFIIPATGTVSPTEPLAHIRHLMETGKLRSVIVAEKNRPVGVIRWNDIRQVANFPDGAMARDIMLADCPTLRSDTPAVEARESLRQVDFDRLPVVDAKGELVGVVPREALIEVTGNGSAMTAPDEQTATRPALRAFTVYPGMNVYGSDGAKLGLVDRMFLVGGAVTGFLVAYGLLGRRHARVDIDLVDHLEDETIILSIDQSQFRRLTDSNS